MGDRFVLQVYVGSLSLLYEALSIEASKITTADEIVECICEKLSLNDGAGFYELAEVMGNEGGQDCKERRIGHAECPVALQLLWPKKKSISGDKGTSISNGMIASGSSSAAAGGSAPDFKFCLRRKQMGSLWSMSTDSNDSQLIRDYFLRFLYQPRNCEYSDLCQLPDLTEQTLLENLKVRFEKGHIYTYVGSILIAVNPFTFYPIYNPKYVQLYQNRRLGELQPHIFAIADAAYQSMLRKRTNQCIVISGESGSGKTESTNLLLHHLTALSQKGTHGSGVEQTILGAGPVLEAFGNAKTKFNNNSSRFGKFIQVNYKENGAVHGALVQKYLLEKSRIVSQVNSERNYHVFYYLLDGLTEFDKLKLYLTEPQDYFYLNQSKCYTLDNVDERHEFSRLTQSMEMVGFSRAKQFLCFKVLSAVLHLGNVEFSKKSTYHSDETVMVKNPEVVAIISKLLQVKEETLTTALTCKRTKAAKGEMLVINYKLPDAIATRDAMAKCLYGALFDWIVMQVNHALLSKKDPREHKGNSIGVLDIFGFEDFADHNNFEQFCINYANERLQYYFNQHVFKYEQEEYQREDISWRNIDFNDNTECLRLIEDRPSGLLYLLDDQCNFPCGSNETVLQKFIYHHNANQLFEVPPCAGQAFIIKHYAGKVKYQIRDFREKNLDLMRPDIVSVLKVSQMAFVRELVCTDPLALFRWQILKRFFKAYFIFSKLREQSKINREHGGNGWTNETYGLGKQRRLSAGLSGCSPGGSGNTLPASNGIAFSRMNSPKNVPHFSSSTSSSTMSSCSFSESECVGVTVGGGGGGGGSKVGAAAVVSASHLHQQHHHRPYHLHNHQVNHNQPTLNSRTSASSSSCAQQSSSSSLSHMSHGAAAAAAAVAAHGRAAQCVHGVLVRTISTSGNFSCPVHGTQAHLCSSEAKVMSRANKILMKKKYSTTPSYLSRKHSFDKSIRNFKLLKQLLGPPSASGSSSSSISTAAGTMSAAGGLSTGGSSSTSSIGSLASSSGKQHGLLAPRAVRKQTPTVTHQFQQSLQQLMDTLSHANPFFVRCIKSNADKMPKHFDDRLVLQQLRYTGMLETVRIRQSGYSVRLTFDEFIQHYRILLPRGLLSSKMDVKEFLANMRLQPNMHQIGKTKVFMRESEKLVLDERLHEEILRRIINLQRWVRTWLCRKRFSEVRNAAIVIQTYARRYIAQKRLSQLKIIAQNENWAANCIQKHWRCYQMRKWFASLRRSVVSFQSSCRGFLFRERRMRDVVEECAKQRAEHLALNRQMSNLSVSIRTTPPNRQQQQQATLQASNDLEEEEEEQLIDKLAEHMMGATTTTGDIPAVQQAELRPSLSVGGDYARTKSNTVVSAAANQTTLEKKMVVMSDGNTNNTLANNKMGYEEEDVIVVSSSADYEDNVEDDDVVVVDADELLDDDFANDDQVRLNRKRNIPIRKTSFKRKVSNNSTTTTNNNNNSSKSLSEDKLLTLTATGGSSSSSSNIDLVSQSHGVMSTSTSSNLSDGHHQQQFHHPHHHQQYQQQHRQLTKLSSDSNVLLSAAGIDAKSNSSTTLSTSLGYNTNSDSASSIGGAGGFRSSDANAGSSSSSNQTLQWRVIPGSSTSSSAISNQQQQQQQQQQQSSIGPLRKAIKSMIPQILHSNNTSDSVGGHTKRTLKQTSSSTATTPRASFEAEESDIGPKVYHSKSLSNIDHRLHMVHQPSIDLGSSSSSQQRRDSGAAASTSKGRATGLHDSGNNYTLLLQHSLQPETNFKSGEICAICENSITTAAATSSSNNNNNQSLHYKCSECRQLFHNKCLHLNRDIPCCLSSPDSSSSSVVLAGLNPPRPPRNKQKKIKGSLSSDYHLMKESPGGESSSATLLSHSMLSSTDSNENMLPASPVSKQPVRFTEFTDPHDILITDLDELQTMDKFISKKIREREEVQRKTKAKASMIDLVFALALKEFRSNLITTYAASNADGYIRLTYKDLIGHFEEILRNVCKLEKTYTTFPVTLGVNAFRGYMDELRKKQEGKNQNKPSHREIAAATGGGGEPAGANTSAAGGGSGGTRGNHKLYKRKASKKARNRNKKEEEIFVSYDHEFQLSTANIYTVCEMCSSYMWLMEKIWICRRCKYTIHKKCAEKVNSYCKCSIKPSNKKLFGAPLSSLLNDAECRIPVQVENLIMKIEIKGLYMEGLYRKSGIIRKITELRHRLDSGEANIDLDQYSVHVLASILKLFLREMPEPLMTFELYDDFLWATTITDPNERVQVILGHITKLPKANFDLLERLTFHLARIAQNEPANRMNANSLAIIFAPCLLKTNKSMQTQDTLNDIHKQTLCLESIIKDRMRQISDTLCDIETLDDAYHTTSSRLSSIRHSRLHLNRDTMGVTRTSSNVEEEEAMLTHQLDMLETEKNNLTVSLPAFRLAAACSDEDMLSANETEEAGGNSHASININHGAGTSGSGNNKNSSSNNNKEMSVPSTPTYQPTNIKTNAKFINNLSCSVAGTSGAAVASASPKPRVTGQPKCSTTNNHTTTNNNNNGITDAAECVLAVERDEKLI